MPLDSAMRTPVRHAHVYSVIRNRRSRQRRSSKSRKQYNYLTPTRMITKPRKTSLKAARLRDDKILARRHNYKEQLLRNVEEKIRFFPPVVKKSVFFPTRWSGHSSVLFRGHRNLGCILGTRVELLVLEQLKKAEQRPFLIEKMQSLGVEPPTAEEWAKFTDPKTGDINIGICYSQYVETLFYSFTRSAMGHPGRVASIRSLAALRDYAVLNAADPTRVPPLELWAQALGPIQDSDFCGRTRGSATQQVKLSAALLEMREYGRAHLFEAVSALSLAEQVAVSTEAAQRQSELLAELQQRHVFATKIKHVLFSLDEIMAIHAPSMLYSNFKRRQFIIEHKGVYYPRFHRREANFKKLSAEEKAQWYTFGIHHEPHPSTGQKLYLRFCVRDYGIPITEAARRYNQLSDLQRAALCFPFYSTIAPSRASVAAYKRFYREMCGRYGLVTPTGPIIGNRLFEAAMRKRWQGLSVAERARYEEADRIADVFPLVKPSSADAPPSSTSEQLQITPDSSLPPSSHTPHLTPRAATAPLYSVFSWSGRWSAVGADDTSTGVKADYFTEDDRSCRTASLDELVASAGAGEDGNPSADKTQDVMGSEREGGVTAQQEDEEKVAKQAESVDARASSSRTSTTTTPPPSVKRRSKVHAAGQQMSESLCVSSNDASRGGSGAKTVARRRKQERESKSVANDEGVHVIMM